MEKLKKIKLSNQMKWMILVGVILFIFVVLSVVHIIDYKKLLKVIKKHIKITLKNKMNYIKKSLQIQKCLWHNELQGFF